MKKYLFTFFIFIALGLTALFINKQTPTDISIGQAKPTSIAIKTLAANNISEPKLKTNTVSENSSIQTFEEFERKFNSQMPDKNQLKQLKWFDAHHSHPYLKEATNLLLDASDYFKTNNSAEEKQLEFYLTCTEKENFFNSIRATCLFNARTIYFKLTGQKLPLDFFDTQVALIANELD